MRTSAREGGGGASDALRAPVTGAKTTTSRSQRTTRQIPSTRRPGTRAGARRRDALPQPPRARAAAPRFGRRRALTRLVALGFVAYGAHALLELQFAAPPADDGEGAIVGVACDGADPETRAEAYRAPSAVVVELRLPDPDPESGKSRYYGANHWFQVRVPPPQPREAPHRERASPGPGPADRVPAVILRLADARWRAQLTPMTRLLALAYTDGTARRVLYAPSAVATSPTDGTEVAPRACPRALGTPPSTGPRSRVRRRRRRRPRRRVRRARAALRVGPRKARASRGPRRKNASRSGAAKAERGVSADGRRRRVHANHIEACAPPPRGRAARPRRRPRAPRGCARGDDGASLATVLRARGGARRAGRRAVIYQRDGRALGAVDEVASALQRALEASGGEGSVARERRDARRALPPCALAACLRDAEVLLTPHGFQSMLYLFLPPRAARPGVPAQVLQARVQTRRAEWGGAHAFTISPPRNLASRVISAVSTGQCMSMYYCGSRAKGKRPRRAADVAPSSEPSPRARARRRRSLRLERRRSEGREASSGPFGPSGVEWAAAGEATSRAAWLAACAANHSCQRFRFEEEEGGREAGGDARCALRVDPGQGERDGDVIGAGIYNNKCWVPGC